MKDSNSNRGIIWTMAGIILILVIVLLYFFVFTPQYNNFVVKKQTEGFNTYYVQMLQAVDQNGFIQIPLGNQTLILAAVSPEELQFLAQARQQQAAAQQAPQTGTKEQVQATNQ